MDSVLVVYYSRTGTTRQVAEQLAQLAQWPIAEVTDIHSRVGLWGDLRCLFDVLLRDHAQYRYDGPDVAGFAQLVVLAPVWAQHLASPMRTFLRDRSPVHAQVSMICTMASRGGFRAVDEVAAVTSRVPSPVAVFLQQDVLSGISPQQLEDFAAQVRSSAQYAVTRERPLWLSPEAG